MHPDERVKILTFSSFHGLSRLPQEDDLLRTCHDDLQRHAFSCRLADASMGSGMQFVRHNVAQSLLEELERRRMELTASQIIVSREFEPAVLNAVKRQFSRSTWVKSNRSQVLDLLWMDDSTLDLNSP